MLCPEEFERVKSALVVVLTAYGCGLGLRLGSGLLGEGKENLEDLVGDGDRTGGVGRARSVVILRYYGEGQSREDLSEVSSEIQRRCWSVAAQFGSMSGPGQ